MFVGKKCRLCANPNWDTNSKGVDEKADASLNERTQQEPIWDT
jgi:hypothetical protein